MFCSNCGNQLKEGAEFCTYCGTKSAPLFDLPKEPENTAPEQKVPERMSRRAFYETMLPPSVHTSVETGILLFFIGALIYLFMALFDLVTGLLMAAVSLTLGVIVKKTKSFVWAVIACGVSGLALVFGLISGSSFTFWTIFAAIFSVIGCSKFDKAYKEYLLTGAVPLLSDSDKRAVDLRIGRQSKKWVGSLILSVIAVLLIGANVVHAAFVIRCTKDFDVGSTAETRYKNDYYGFKLKIPKDYETMDEDELAKQNESYYGKNYSAYGTADLFYAVRRDRPEKDPTKEWREKYENDEDFPILSSIIVSSYFNGTLMTGLTEVADSYLEGVRTESREKVEINGIPCVAACFESTDDYTDEPVFVAVFIFRSGPYSAVVTVSEQSREALDRLIEEVIGYKFAG